jgi:hypothetical protein
MRINEAKDRSQSNPAPLLASNNLHEGGWWGMRARAAQDEVIKAADASMY